MSYQPRKSRRHEDHSVDDWLMTYADLITLLVCFFAIFLSVSVPRKDVFNRAREEVLKKFSEEDPVNIPPRDDFSNTEQGRFPAKYESTNDAPFEAMSSIIDNYRSQGDINIEEGDRITTIEMSSAPFFSSGSADLNPEGVKVLSSLYDGLNKDNLQDYQITVEGHTDDNPISTPRYPSNWELSTGRAGSVIRFFLDKGFPAKRMRAAGYADALPKVPNRDAGGKPIPENQAKNRRVIIRMEKVDKMGEMTPKPFRPLIEGVPQ